jgi:hypothetical protein
MPTTLPNQRWTIPGRNGSILPLSLSSTANLLAHTTPTTTAWQQVPAYDKIVAMLEKKV